MKLKKYIKGIAIAVIAFLMLLAASRIQETLKTAVSSEAIQIPSNAPPIIIFTTQALGGFRGIIADILWMNAIKAQKEKHFFEALQLASWITSLEPDFTRVWGFQAWNIAYNISECFPSPLDRWRWVKNGISLIRDKGIKYNPTSQKLYVDLAWLFQHKINFYMDDAHIFYKRKFAEEIGEILPEGKLIELPEPHQKLLLEKFGLVPEQMREIEDKYGITDWRIADSHAVYFAYIGKNVAEKKSEDPYISQDLIARSLINAFKSGRLVINRTQNLFCLTPNLKIYPAVTNIFEEMLKNGENEFIRERYNTFLANASVFLACYNKNEESRQLYNTLIANDAHSTNYPKWEAFTEKNMKIEPARLGIYETIAIAESTLLKAIKAENEQKYETAKELYQKTQQFLQNYNDSLPTDNAKIRLSAPSIEALKYSALLRLKEN
jgi:hypothetical protein